MGAVISFLGGWEMGFHALGLGFISNNIIIIENGFEI